MKNKIIGLFYGIISIGLMWLAFYIADKEGIGLTFQDWRSMPYFMTSVLVIVTLLFLSVNSFSKK